MKTLIRGSFLVTVVALWVGFAAPLSAATWIFNNSLNDLGSRLDPGTSEVGDQILLASTERYLTYFDFEYWGVNTASQTSFAGDVEARVRFYQNNGTPFNGYDTPGLTPFFDSGWFGGFGPTELTGFRGTLIFTAGLGLDFPEGGLYIPVNEMTWSVQFRGMEATDTVGVDIYSPPTVGSDYPDYWQNDGTELSPAWTLLTNTVPMNFAARFEANEAIPEPSTLVISLVGGLGILTMLRRLRRAS